MNPDEITVARGDRTGRYRYVLPDIHRGEHRINIADNTDSALAALDSRSAAATPSDKTPLLQDKIMRSLSGTDRHTQFDGSSAVPMEDQEGGVHSSRTNLTERRRPHGAEGEGAGTGENNRTLGTFAGVFAPVALSIFSSLLFLRMGLVVGQAGILLTIVILLISYAVLGLTILSICAISTNGAVQGGGAYFMISRTLGPEFGGALGLLFFLANSCASALYVAGFVETVVDNFGPEGSVAKAMPGGYWFAYLYKTVVNVFNVVICLLGAGVFSLASAGLFVITLLCYLVVLVSFFVNHTHKDIPLSEESPHCHHNGSHCTGNYTGFDLDTLKGNLYYHWEKDYTTGKRLDFLHVFAILFSSVTGIMAGANMSGELKDPKNSIPRGTVQATCFTLIAYTILAFMLAFTCDNFLLLNNYNVLEEIDVHVSVVLVGIFVTTLSAALACLIGASRVLEAVAKDQLFGFILRPAMYATKSGNPVVAVFVGFFIVQLVSFVDKFNLLAPVVTVLYLLVYAFSNLACLTLELASAPNFRPTFSYYSWHTCFLGFVSSLAMAFVVQPVYAAGAVIALLLLVIFIWWYAPPAHAWGSISQALIFHQVRKYLLMLDSRREHVKYWRPQVLLLVANPRSSCHLIDFVNDMKKGGLYVLGNVQVGTMDDFLIDPTITAYPFWLGLVDHLKVKAFVELTVASSVREGIHNLYRLSGLGGMKPNTVCLGFYDDSPPRNLLAVALTKRNKKPKVFHMPSDQVDAAFPAVRTGDQRKSLQLPEYMDILFDIIKSQKNILIARNFHKFNRTELKNKKVVVDVWPNNFLQPSTSRLLDTTSLLMLQLACILEMVEHWHKAGTHIRVFLCVTRGDDFVNMKKTFKQILAQLRIPAKVVVVHWDHVTFLHPDAADDDSGQASAGPVASHAHAEPSRFKRAPDEFLKEVNLLVKQHSRETTVSFMYLALPPSDASQHSRYIEQYEWITRDAAPTILVHGVSSVTTTVL